MCMWVCVWVLYTHNHTHIHTRTYIYIFAYECVPAFPVIVLWCRIPCPSILRSHPWIACIHLTVSDTEESVCRIHRWWTGHQVAGKWSSNGGRSCRHPLPRISENIRDIPIFGDLKLKSSRKKSGFRLGGSDCNVDPRWGGIGCDMWNDATRFWCGTSLTSQETQFAIKTYAFSEDQKWIWEDNHG